MTSRSRRAALALVLGTTLATASACGSTTSSSEAGATSAATAGTASTVTVTDDSGKHEITTPVRSVVALDNRSFETLSDWGVKPKAAARALMPATNPLKKDESIVDIGNHREPKLELLVAAKPDVVINGQRFTTKAKDIAKLVPDATQLVFDVRKGQPLDAELKRQTTELGTLFGKAAEAKALNAKLDDAVAAAKKAYPAGQKVMAVNVSGGKIGYIAPDKGRTLGPVFPLLGLTPALEVTDASDDHQGDDISVEAIAKSNPDWILVMDRDAAVNADDPSYKSAQTVLEQSEALKKVTAVTKKQIVYMPADTYTNEGIQTYTEFLTSLAKAFSGAQA